MGLDRYIPDVLREASAKELSLALTTAPGLVKSAARDAYRAACAECGMAEPEATAAFEKWYAAEWEERSERTMRPLTSQVNALLERLRLAELALHRARLLADDIRTHLEAMERKNRPVPPEAVANMVGGYVKSYVDPVIEPLREALGFESVEGWYVAAEELRAKLVGAARARERLRPK
jgi:hypothetical protein